MAKPVRIAQVLQKYLFRLNVKTCTNRTGFAKIFIQTQCENLCESHRFCKNIYSDSMRKPVRIAHVLQKYLFRLNEKTCANRTGFAKIFIQNQCENLCESHRFCKNIYSDSMRKPLRIAQVLQKYLFRLNEKTCANRTGFAKIFIQFQ